MATMTPSLFVTFSPEGVAWERKATMTYRQGGSSCELLERIGGQWQPVSILSSTDVNVLLAHIKAWCQGN